ncbi:toprim domain-containing protein [Prevotella sp. kh1p2]|uniref:toprim domain-containing protein n=1 Tax=Prevotella sp. kh1p2 TaxID=1761883 RepID=UPI0008C6EABA|nr:toprim domain-containing protein [Prevotella sp. kh1p2]SES78540.1 CHC2 zinc finger [Prevotella sp. kh1p2]SNU10616.1 CHC2 zinc finger [Prevotellaceae bacterium KH2P17]
MDARQMREIPIADFLNAMGIHPARQRGNALWYSAPYRTERTPSFKVDTTKNVWFDFGTGKGGDIFDLAGEFIGSGDFLLRAAFIAKSGTCPLPIMERPQRNEEKEPVFEDIWVRPLQDSKLLGYLRERGIFADIAITNCEEVRYRVHGKRYYAIGFRNKAGGWELRNRFFKGCIPPKDISLRRNGSDVCAVFEGFMDYLSAMQLGIIASDWLVLNSVSNVEKALKVLGGYRRIDCYLDNDDAGHRTLERLREDFGEKVFDRSSLYAGHKDLNDYLLSQKQD